MSLGGGSEGSAFQIIVLVISLIAITVVAVASTSAYVRRRRAKSNNITDALRWSSNYRDDPNSGPNLAPRRSSIYDEDYPANAHSSSTDPMVTHLAPKTTASMTGTRPDVASPSADGASSSPQVYIGPPRDEDGHELHNVQII